jgi:hypothetical protein
MVTLNRLDIPLRPESQRTICMYLKSGYTQTQKQDTSILAEKSRHKDQIMKKKKPRSIPKINVKGGSPTPVAGCVDLSFTPSRNNRSL